MTHNDSNIGGYLFSLWAIGLFAYAAATLWREWKRLKRVGQFLVASGLEPWKASLPSYFPSQLLDFPLADARIRTCHAGKYHGHSAIVAEVRIGSGKHAYNQTFVAVEQPTASRYERPKFVTALELQYVQQDRWVIGTISKQTLDVGAIEGYLNCFT